MGFGVLRFGFRGHAGTGPATRWLTHAGRAQGVAPMLLSPGHIAARGRAAMSYPGAAIQQPTPRSPGMSGSKTRRHRVCHGLFARPRMRVLQ